MHEKGCLTRRSVPGALLTGFLFSEILGIWQSSEKSGGRLRGMTRTKKNRLVGNDEWDMEMKARLEREGHPVDARGKIWLVRRATRQNQFVRAWDVNGFHRMAEATN